MSENSVLIIAGESSGDLHGSALIDEIKTLSPDLKLFGIGGHKMRSSGLELIFHSDELNFMGFIEVIKHIPYIKKIQKKIIEEVINRKTKYAILIDYPGFNLSLAKKLKNLNVKILYFISPQIWAWGHSRIKKIKKLISKMFVLFPFEEEFYKKFEVEAEYVGHPLITILNNYKFLNKSELLEKFNLDKSKEILLLLPGSRKHEVSLILPSILPAAEKLSKLYNMQIVIACSNSIEEDFIRSSANSNSYKIISGYTYDLMKNSKFGIIKSGTSTLEAGLLGLPMIIVYKANYLSYLIGMLLIKVKYIGIVNILSGRLIVPELLQTKLTEKNILSIVNNLLSNPQKIELMKQELSNLSQKLGSKNSAKITAKKIIDFINEEA